MPGVNGVDEDLYEILGVDEDASQDEIKKAYKKLAKKYHPDRSDEPNAEQKFKKVSKAYEVLSDPEQRQQYDQSRKYGQGFGGVGGGPGGFSYEGSNIEDILNDLGLGDIGRGSQRQGRGGQDSGTFVDFSDLFGGTTSGRQTRDPRGGQRQQPGRGRQKQQPKRDEIKRIIPLKLALLGGKLKVKTPAGNTIKVSVDAGTKTGDTLRIPDQGKNGQDLYIEFEVKMPDLTDEQRAEIRDILY